MSMQNFRPEIWSKVILASLQKKLVYGSPMVVNEDYEGEIAGPGDAVHITQFGDPTISTYTPGSGSITYQNDRVTRRAGGRPRRACSEPTLV